MWTKTNKFLRTTRLVILCWICILFGTCVSAADTDKKIVEQSALEFSAALSSGNAGQAFPYLTLGVQKALTKQGMQTNMDMAKIMSGGPASDATVVGSTSFSQLPNGQLGSYYYVRIFEKFPNGPQFLDIYFLKVGMSWQIDQYTFSAAPYCG